MYTLKTAVIALFIAFGASIFVCPMVIPLLRKLKFGQNVRDDGPQTHMKKSGTPTMGGIAILICFFISAVFFLNGNKEAQLLAFITLAYGVIGFLDDYIKVVMKRSLGLRAWQKIVLQTVATCLFIFFLMKIDDPNNSYRVIAIPFFEYKWDMGILFYPFLFFFMIGFGNAVNLTDGIDGLASGITALVATFFMFSAWAIGSGILPLTGSAVGCLLGFLIFNTYPAKVFMGDTGSLALGGFVSAGAIILKMPLFLLIVGVIYLLEALSVMIQVSYFKVTKGKRFFKMAPLHHHFELSGFPETKIVSVSYIATAILCIIGYLGSGYLY